MCSLDSSGGAARRAAGRLDLQRIRARGTEHFELESTVTSRTRRFRPARCRGRATRSDQIDQQRDRWRQGLKTKAGAPRRDLPFAVPTDKASAMCETTLFDLHGRLRVRSNYKGHSARRQSARCVVMAQARPRSITDRESGRDRWSSSAEHAPVSGSTLVSIRGWRRDSGTQARVLRRVAARLRAASA